MEITICVTKSPFADPNCLFSFNFQKVMQKKLTPTTSGSVSSFRLYAFHSPGRDRTRPTCVSWANTFPFRSWSQSFGCAEWPPKSSYPWVGAPTPARACPVEYCAVLVEWRVEEEEQVEASVRLCIIIGTLVVSPGARHRSR